MTSQRVGGRRRGLLGSSWLPNGATVTWLGWLGWCLFCGGLAAAAVEAALMMWGSGTWPEPGMPWISLDLMAAGAVGMVVDVLRVELHDRWVVVGTDQDADLMSQLPQLMAGHADIGWRVSPVPTGGFLVDLWLAADESRAAGVRVTGRRRRASRDFAFSFAAFDGPVFSPPFQSNAEALGELLSHAASVLRGPSQVIVDRAGNETVRVMLRCGPDLADPWFEEVGTDRLTKRLMWRLQGNTLERITHQFPAYP